MRHGRYIRDMSSTPIEFRRWLAAGACALAAAGASAAPASAEPYAPAFSFTDSVGVNLRLSAPNTPYYNLTAADRGSVYGSPRRENGTSSAPQVKALMADLGVKHARYDFCDEALAFVCQRGNATARTLHTDLGVKFLDAYFGAGVRSVENLNAVNGGSIAAEVSSQLATAAAPSNAPAIEALEGPNEMDRGNVANWAPKVSEAQFRAVAGLSPGGAYASLGDRTLLNAPMGSSGQNTTPTLVSSPASTGFHAFSESAPALDASNQHTYSYTSCPEAALSGATIPAPAGQPCEDRTGNTTCTGGKPAWRTCSAMIVGTTKPIWLTESGYSSSLDTLEGMSEKAASIYLPRLLLESARLKLQNGRGWDRSYVFELLDGKDGIQCANLICSADREAGHGLVAANFAPKLQFRALKNTLAVLGDTAGSGANGSYGVMVSPSSQDAVRRLLFRKADGTYVLALWRPVKVWNQATRNWYGAIVRGSDIPEGTAPNTTTTASVTLPTAKALTISRPSQSATPTETRPEATNHTVAVGGDVTLVTWR